MSNSGSQSFEDRVKKAAKYILNSKHLVVFTGAGISTESGIPDYRGPDGVWTRRDLGLPPPVMKKPWNEISPNDGHKAIYLLQEMGLLKFLISQNVDNLHLNSGIKEKIIAEFHGNGALMRCLNCNKKFPKEGFWDEKIWGQSTITENLDILSLF